MPGPIPSDLLGAISGLATESFAHSIKQDLRHVTTLKLGPFSILLACQTKPLYDAVVPQFGLIAGPAGETSDLTVRVLEDPESLARLEKLWSTYDLPEGNTSTTFRHNNLRIHAEFDDQGLALLFALDLDTSLAVLIATNGKRVRQIVGAYPLLLLLRLWSERTPYLWAHGAVVGTGKAGVVLTGIGGSGKSSTSLSISGGKLKLIGDDYVLVSPDRIAHSIYSTVRIRQDMVQRIEALDPWFGKQWFSWRGKPSQVVPADKYRFLAKQMPLKAVILLRHHCSDPLTFHRMPRAAGVRAITPVTVSRYYSNPAATLEKLTSIISPLPVYEFHTSPDLSAMREPFENFVNSLEQ